MQAGKRVVCLLSLLSVVVLLPGCASQSPRAKYAAGGIGPLPPVSENPDNRYTPERVALGKALFFDNRISKNGDMNCSTCHLPQSGWTVPAPFSPANEGFVERRNPPTLINVGYNKALIWDGRAPSLEKQAIGSTKNPVHKGQNIDKLMTIFKRDPHIVELFDKAYGSEPNARDYGRAIAVFERHTLITGDSDFDRFMKGDSSALSASAQRGMQLFTGRAGCVSCHNGPNFTDSDFHNIGLKRNPRFDEAEFRHVLQFDAKRKGLENWREMNDDPGRYLVTHKPEDWNKFKTPTLRNLADTAPYMHDGRYATLDEVIEHYNRGGDGTRNQDPRIRPLNLSEQGKADLKAFLLSLWGPLPEI